MESVDGKKIHLGSDYDSRQGVFVTILNSWTKEKSYLHVTRNSDRQWTHATYQSGSSPDWVNVPHAGSGGEYSFVNGVRTLLNRLMQQVAEVMQTVTLGAVGVRALDLDGGVGGTGLGTSQMSQVVEQVSKATGISSQVIAKFAAIGNRSLDL